MKSSLFDRALAAGAGSTGVSGRAARRMVSGDVREHLRELRPKLDLLPMEDRLMVELVSTGERSMHEYARITSQNAGNLSRRHRSIWRRLHDPALDFVMGSRCPLPPEHRQIGVENILLGMTVCSIADKHRMSKTQVQVVLAYIRGYVGSRGMVASVSAGPDHPTLEVSAGEAAAFSPFLAAGVKPRKPKPKRGSFS